MNTAEMIKAARERLGLTQEDLAEKLEVSRQAVSKWELGASAPSPENLELLEEVLDIRFPTPEEALPQAGLKTAFWSRKRTALLTLEVLAVAALLSIGMYLVLQAGKPADAPRPSEPFITEIAFFDGDASPLRPELGDGWLRFTSGERVLIAVEFTDGAGDSVVAVSLFLTPAGTETFDLREQIAVQAVSDGRNFALFAWDVPRDLSGHLEVVLECGGGQRVTETRNVTAAPPPALHEEPGTLSAADLSIRVGDPNTVLRVLGVPAQDVAWISADPDIAGVSTAGMVWGVSPGVTTVTAEWNGQTAECVVRVAEGPVGEEGNTDLPAAKPHSEQKTEQAPLFEQR